MRSLIALVLAFLATWPSAVAAQQKFGPDATPLFGNLDYFRKATSTDYWLLSAFYIGQRSPNDSSVASAVMAANALLGLPERANDEVIRPGDLINQVANQKWLNDVAPSGRGVTASEFGTYLRESLNAVGLESATIAATTPASAEQAALDTFRAALATSEASLRDVMLVHFDRSIVTGSGGLHISPIGAYDEGKDLVLVMDVDRDHYIPYWTPAATLLVAMVKPAATGPLAGERGGYFVVARP